MASLEAFKNHIIEAGVLDPEGTHHEFKSGMHGQKLDFDLIPDNSDLYDEWVEVTSDFIRRTYDWLPEIVVGVANGTNRLALDVARSFKGKMIGLTTEKDGDDNNLIRLTKFARQVIVGTQPDFVLVLEDVGTTGSSSVQPAREIRDLLNHDRPNPVEVVTTWRRRPELEKLIEADIPYKAVIDTPLDTFKPEECSSKPKGFCYKNWELIPRES